MSKAKFGLYVGDVTEQSSYAGDNDELVMDECDGWRHNVDCFDYKDAFEQLAYIVNTNEYSDMEDRVVRLVEYPTNEIVDGEKVEL